jgi:hypothetical protein
MLAETNELKRLCPSAKRNTVSEAKEETGVTHYRAGVPVGSHLRSEVGSEVRRIAKVNMQRQ